MSTIDEVLFEEELISDKERMVAGRYPETEEEVETDGSIKSKYF